ncbi:malonic semialdehyde reductase [Thiohalomonas denitrificans]|uniref:malonic semialdehyde reductase n=1 Tax=Thiohalomonas denitrificans TaxID=415747 RepID=UPI0026F324D5|nr:malonic semialdehyde reductase [Thiohalomonas denitrificans]
MTGTLDEQALETLFRGARSFSYWQDKPVSDEQLHAIYDLMKRGPTSANCLPARLVFVKSTEAKERLKPSLAEGNVHKSMNAPVVAIIGMDLEFYEKLPRLFPHSDARSWYAGKPEKIYETAFRNSSLQGAYFLLAARSLGLDCGPMSGFDSEKLDAAFFPEGTIKSNFICAIGYGDASRLHARGPRLEFEEACRIL